MYTNLMLLNEIIRDKKIMVPSPYLKMYRPFLHYFNNNVRNFFFHRNIAVLFEKGKTNAFK